MFDTSCFIKQKYMYKFHGHVSGLTDLCIQHKVLLVNLSINWPINTLLIEHLAVI